MTFKLFDYQAEFMRDSGMCPRKVDKSQPLCPPDKCPKCKKEAKKALLDDLRSSWHGEPVNLKGETSEKEPLEEDDGVPKELKKFEPLFHFDPKDLISHEPLPTDVSERIRKEMTDKINRDIMGFG